MLMRRKPLNPGKGFKNRGGFAGAGKQAKHYDSDERDEPHTTADEDEPTEQDEGHYRQPGQADSREHRLAERAARQIAAARETAHLNTSSVTMKGMLTGLVIEKENVVESEKYRRLVAKLPCLWCGIAGYSQHAHLNYGKGLGMKTDDRTGFPLCCTRPGVEGCHVAYDQYRLLESGGREAHREYGLIAGAFTREQIRKAGLWPRDTPAWPN